MDKANLKVQIEAFEKFLDSLYLDSLSTPEEGLNLISLFENVSDDFKQQMWSRIPPLLNQENPSGKFDRQWIRWIWNQSFLLFQMPQVQELYGDFDRQGFKINIHLEHLPISLKTDLLTQLHHQPEHPQETLFFSFKVSRQ